MILFRHARTAHNAQARLQGHSDPPLDDVGLEQAAMAGRALMERWQVDRVVLSSLQRTHQTAEAAGLQGLPTTIDDRWMEINFGSYDNYRISDIAADLFKAWATDVHHVPPGGESIADLHERVGAALQDQLTRARDENIVVVTHTTPIKSAVAWMLGSGPNIIIKLRVSLASITAFSSTPYGWVLNEFNWTPARGIDQN